jgi:ubiquinone/menaquinone biosynthesis C-methylase UbiE
MPTGSRKSARSSINARLIWTADSWISGSAVETVDRVVQGKQYSEILDIGCGDGSISVPLLNSNCRLTLLDVSPGMLSIARSRVPEELSSRVKFVNQDFMQVPFEKKLF